MFTTDETSSGQFGAEHFTMECGTCLAAGTTACNECVVTHLLANDDGPINLLTVALEAPSSPQERVITLFERSGLLDDPVEFVSIDRFESFASSEAHLAPSLM